MALTPLKILCLEGLPKMGLLQFITIHLRVVNFPLNAKSISTSCISRFPWEDRKGPKVWPTHNLKIYPPQEIGEPLRPAYYCHMKTNIKYSTLKLWYVACLIRGMPIDEAVRQLEYVHNKGAYYVKETLLEAQELAVKTQNVEFKSNLWVAESFCTKGIVIKGVRRHAKSRVGIIHYVHSHYFIRLEEGVPPKDYYPPEPDGPTLLKSWIQQQRDQRVVVSV